MVVQIIDQLYIAAEDPGNIPVQRLKAVTLGSFSQHNIERLQSRGQFDKVSPVLPDAVAQSANLIRSSSLIINEWATQHLRIFDRIGVNHRSVNVGIHNLQMTLSNIS